MANTLKVTLVKSPISAKPKHRATVEALGLRKLNKTVELPNNAATLGMVKQVQHLVKVEEEFPYRFYVSDAAEKFKSFANSILPYDVEMTKQVNLEE